METYRVLVFEGDIDAVIDPYSPALTFKDISWDEAVELCRLAFSQKFGCVLWQVQEEESNV